MRRYTEQEKSRLVELVSQSSLLSDASFYAWRKQIARSQKEKSQIEEAVTEEKSKSTAYGISPQDVEKLLALKKEHPYFGIVKLSKQIRRSEGIQIPPSKIKRILEDHGYESQEIPAAPPKGTLDIMYYRLKKEGRFYLISVLDDYSRFIVSHRVFTTQTADNVIQVFKQAVQEYGVPNQVLTDRGSQFYSWKGISQFQELLGNLNVEHILTSPQSPQTIGKAAKRICNHQRSSKSHSKICRLL